MKDIQASTGRKQNPAIDFRCSHQSYGFASAALTVSEALHDCGDKGPPSSFKNRPDNPHHDVMPRPNLERLTEWWYRRLACADSLHSRDGCATRFILIGTLKIGRASCRERV